MSQIACKNCGSEGVVKYGTYNGVQRYWCKVCQRKFDEEIDVSQQGDTFKLSGITLNNSYDSRYGSYYNQNLPLLEDGKYVYMVNHLQRGANNPSPLKGHTQHLPCWLFPYITI